MSEEKPKGVIHVLPSVARSPCHSAVHHFSSHIDEDTQAVGFFVLKKDRTVISGCSYDVGFTATDLFGSCEYLKNDMYEKIWGDDVKK